MISVLGAGAFGTSLAIALGAKGHVCLWARDPEHVAEMIRARENTKRLPGVPLPARVTPTADLAEATAADVLLLALPMQKLAAFLAGEGARFDGKTLIACCKGIDVSTLSGPLQVIAHGAPSAKAALLTGPSFAADIAVGLPTALTLACGDDALGAALQEKLSTPALRLYRTTDTIGAELGGALKNVVAIGAGIVIGAGLGDSARAALITRGFAEIQRLAQALGGEAETLVGLSGHGDLILTCTSDKSRNFRFGCEIGSGQTPDSGPTVEGAATARAALNLSRQHGLDLPVVAAVVTLLDRPEALDETVAALLSRPLKSE
ncbi:glycerol-3-phosphate dehydrogenase (NAD(P)+) [Poseidonocella pacifica]|uniref:Glycerol-3-phosphate dehydrogenase [NAD(P)+] n=1 Tax=Poseidonocella pacifica TaxID=871651 RepID=A0A1I0XYA4_9RHOB|nr:NAD(P)H-dependent glycerol-3-phosphate dehydrogenase [Poseidonocella pacifica]SFB06012.1 glycerol-3-phosphate dehydrogenase (NAD(P)+) [Poseidonocella pacifica]